MRFGSRLAWIQFLFLTMGLLLPGGSALVRAQPEADPKGSGGQPSYTGAGSCGSSQCHGMATARKPSQFRVRQDEHLIWLNRDRHAKAWSVLGDDRSKQILENLHLKGTAQQTDRCLDCHALNVPRGRQGAAFKISDGVSCEECHGPAQYWLGDHTIRGWTENSAEEKQRKGMENVKDGVKRVQKCLSCHLGNATKQVDHELIAAGHPDLYFELDSFSGQMPAHWNAEKEPWFGVRSWLIGQAVSVRESMKLLQLRAGAASESWPEFAEYDCFACHHDLTKDSKDSWRQARGWEWKAGQPRRNGSRHVLFQAVLKEVAPGEAAAIETDLRALDNLMVTGGRNREKISETAGRLATALDPVISRLSGAGAPASADGARMLMRAIASDADNLSFAGYRVAEQAYMALRTVYIDLASNNKPANDAAIRSQMQVLESDLVDFTCRMTRQDPKKGDKPGAGCRETKSLGGSCYDARSFASHLKELQKLLPL